MSIALTDNDPKVCAWLRELVRAGCLSGDVLERDITTMEDDLSGYRQVHFFAGVGGWPLALQWAGWPADWPVWSGSCPCQPFSSAGKRRGTDDPRHLWPVWRERIAEYLPPTIFGEQVASRAGREWLAGVRADLEALGYAVGAADLCAASTGAPHIRQRLFWAAYAPMSRHEQARGGQLHERQGRGRVSGDISGVRDGVAYANEEGRRQGTRRRGGATRTASLGRHNDRRGNVRGRLGDAGCPRPSQQRGRRQQPARSAPPGWDDYAIVRCVEPTRDGGTREVYRRAPLESEFQPLAYGLPARVVRLRGYGNAIVPQVAATFVRAFLETTGVAARRFGD